MHRNDIQHGTDLRDYCKAQGLTQAELAHALRISPRTLHDWLKIHNISRRKPWIHTALLGVETLLRGRKSTSKSSKRTTAHSQFKASLPRRAALNQLPASIRDTMG